MEPIDDVRGGQTPTWDVLTPIHDVQLANNSRGLSRAAPDGERAPARLPRQRCHQSETARLIDTLVHYYECDNANVHRGIHELSNRATAAFEAGRTRVAHFIKARSADEIVFTRGTTEGINLVANAWGNAHLKPGDQILLTEMEHHSTSCRGNCWLSARGQTGVSARHWR